MRRIMGYMPQSDVIGLIETCGYYLLETNEINANSRDTADNPDGGGHPAGYGGRHGSKGVCDSDHITLKFRKR